MVGGDWAEGWQYGPLSVLEYSMATRALEEQGGHGPQIRSGCVRRRSVSELTGCPGDEDGSIIGHATSVSFGVTHSPRVRASLELHKLVIAHERLRNDPCGFELPRLDSRRRGMLESRLDRRTKDFERSHTRARNGFVQSPRA